MSYKISNSRSTRINKQLISVELANSRDSQIDALLSLVMLDTHKDSNEFMIEFRKLKIQHPFINALCKPRGIFGCVIYAFRGNQYKHDRYAKIIAEIRNSMRYPDKVGSCFHDANTIHLSVCNKIKYIRNECLVKIYINKNISTYEADKKTFDELTNFLININYICEESLNLRQSPTHLNNLQQILIAANKIQTKFRKFNKYLQDKPMNEFKIRMLEYKKNKTISTYAFTTDFSGYHLPDANIKRGDRGAYKKIIGDNRTSVLLEQINPLNSVFTTEMIRRILSKYSIKSYIPMVRINKDHYVARNAGAKSLETVVHHLHMYFTPIKFRQILIDTKTLHEAGYFHLDIKLANIQVKILKNGITLSLLDLDSLSSVNRRVQYAGSYGYINADLFYKNFGTKVYQELGFRMVENITCDPSPTNTSLSIHDEFALALTIIETAGIFELRDMSLQDKFCWVDDEIEFIPIAVTKIIAENIKPEYQENFKNLIIRPSWYAENHGGSRLADMFHFN